MYAIALYTLLLPVCPFLFDRNNLVLVDKVQAYILVESILIAPDFLKCGDVFLMIADQTN